eukprot:Hpha_TRINITY_DN6801_c0_g1::TRINITY_DN6801_c0_g1_i1::g.46164::m.46164
MRLCAAAGVGGAAVLAAVVIFGSIGSGGGGAGAGEVSKLTRRLEAVENALRRADERLRLLTSEAAGAAALLHTGGIPIGGAASPPDPRPIQRVTPQRAALPLGAVEAVVEVEQQQPVPLPLPLAEVGEPPVLKQGTAVWKVGGLQGLERRLDDGSIKGDVLPIPSVIHQTWSSQKSVPTKLISWAQGWAHKHPKWQYEFWDDKRIDTLFKSHFPAYHPRLAHMRPIHQADLGRAAIMYVHGGVYADMDMESVAPLDPLVRAAQASNVEVMLAEENLLNVVLLEGRAPDKALASNFFLMSRPRHPLWLCYLHKAFASAGPGCDPVSCTGPRMLDAVVRSGGCTFAHTAYPTGLPPFEAIGYALPLPWQYFSPEPAFWNMGNLRSGCRRGSKEVQRVCKMLTKVAADSKALYNQRTFGVHHWQCSWCRSDPALHRTGSLVEAFKAVGRKMKSTGSAKPGK